MNPVSATAAPTASLDAALSHAAKLLARDPALAAELSKFRDEELAHRDQAVEEGAREAPGYRLLSAVIGAGCRVAIKISEKV